MLTFLDQTMQQPATAPGRGRDGQEERLHHLFEQGCDRHPDRVAVICGQEQITYQELDRRANRLARYLLQAGVRPAERVGILLRRSPDTYVSLLAILKAGAVFVPLDTAFPADRISYIVRDAELACLLTTSVQEASLSATACPLVRLDREQERIAAMADTRIRDAVPGPDNLCYIIYTSGSTGQPKGVAIEHPSICNFVRVAAGTYDIQGTDRIYQGMTIAFDFSIEEIWPGLIRGATIVAGPEDHQRLGDDLAEFLSRHGITVLCCVPTLLATMEQEVPSLRTLIVGGEDCPGHLVERWARPGRRILNTYGPTEATVTATWGELRPGRRVTIGRPLPTYSVYLLDEQGNPVPEGESGEICIGGIGLARGYVNRKEQTEKAFIPDPFQTPDNPSGRLYRTGDLGRRLDNGEIEFLGRIDTQVKLKGYRIELTEIESVLLASPEVRKAVVAPCRIADDMEELVAYCELRPGMEDLDQERLETNLKNQLPPYMVPSWLEIMERIPTLANGKVDRRSLPAPSGRRLGCRNSARVLPADALEEQLAGELARLLNLEQVSVTDDLFLDLGGHSLLVARLVSKLRQDPALDFLALSDLYRYPSVRKLAGHIRTRRRTDTRPRPVRQEGGKRPRPGSIAGCGLLQLVTTWLMGAIYLVPGLMSLERILATTDWSRPAYLHICTLASLGILASFLLSLAMPPIMKWSLLGRVRPGRHRLWGWFFFRVWLVEKALAAAPLFLLGGTPFLGGYYRLLGARIGRDVLLASSLLHLPELITIGSGTRINSGTHIFARAVNDRVLELRPVEIGRDCHIGANSVLMPGARMEDSAALGDQSLLTGGERIPAGRRWTGSPARPAGRRETEPFCRRRGPVGTAGKMILFAATISLLTLVPFAATLPVLLTSVLCSRHLGSLWLPTAGLLAGPVFVLSLCGLIVFLKNLVQPRVRAGRYRLDSLLYIRKWFVDRLLELSLMLTNSLYATLYLAPFLRLLGAKIGRLAEISTISHITPELLTIGDGSFLADIAHVGAVRLEGDSFVLDRVQVGRRAFIGNGACVPAPTATGANSLIGVLSVPPGSEVAPETTWLGSPPICFPEREASQPYPEHLTFAPTPELYRKRLAHEYFRVTLPATCSYLGLAGLFWLASVLLPLVSLPLIALVMSGALLLTGLGQCLVVPGIKKLLISTYTPGVHPMWSKFVWRSELVTGLYESLAVPWLLARFTGTPLLPPLLRLFGARIGKRCFMETTFLTEFDLVEIGDDCCIGLNCSLQTHLFEDRVMKMSRLRIGNRSTVGPRSIILYDAVLEEDSLLDGLTLVMKGETLPAGGQWYGIPAIRRQESPREAGR